MFGITTKILIITIISIYSSYLFFYKCENVGLLDYLHPLNHHQVKFCANLNSFEGFVSPYFKASGDFIEKSVFEHDLVKQYGVKGHVDSVVGHFKHHLGPLVEKLFQFIEFIEIKLYDGASDLYAHGVSLYKSKFA
ncbi:hypothetical protein CLIB1444_06S07074 [[Candida] jaroonii]|uniref:Uncharacterized protein n=1 Tax=[Candida] jaroonii TaxID=467808 RepID=A0ACA9YB43_9ASCO|nr:hypothetical protein CLIB1444_06S07074 [[Candida] jaroonii]